MCYIYIYCLAISLLTSLVCPHAFTSVYSLYATALQCALCISCVRMHCDSASLACSRLRPCNALYAPLASACIATMRRLHAPGYGLAMSFMHLLPPHA